jgi:hypothetical protein
LGRESNISYKRVKCGKTKIAWHTIWGS